MEILIASLLKSRQRNILTHFFSDFAFPQISKLLVYETFHKLKKSELQKWEILSFDCDPFSLGSEQNIDEDLKKVKEVFAGSYLRWKPMCYLKGKQN